MRILRPIQGVVSSVGGVTLGFVGFLGGIGLVVRDTVVHTLRGPFQGQPVSLHETARQGVRVGVKSLGVVAFVNFFVGMILALIGGKILLSLGVPEYVGDLMGVGVVLELGPLITGIIMTGYIGAALAAEIGTMMVSEEITALRTMALHPSRFVVAPRLLAVVLMIPAVSLLGSWVGILGGHFVAVSVLDLSSNAYWERLWPRLQELDVWHGLIKATVFGLIIGGVGCYQGFQVRGGAEGVGRVTTKAVVQSILAIIVSDAILNYFLLFR